MEDWFVVEPLETDTFAISEPRHWEETHCYLLLGRERAALIDTGLGVSDLRAVVERLTPLSVEVLTTHAHWDHIGGHGRFDHISAHGAERGWLADQFPIPLAVVKGNLLRGACDFPEGFRPERYRLFQGEPQRLLRDGDRIDLGGRVLRVIHTPGHSPGHCCFYEEARGDLYAGDLAYRGCLDAFYPTTDPAAFLDSLERVAALGAARVWPGHRALRIPPDLPARAAAAFRSLQAQGKLTQGSGRFDFGDFSIHV